MDVILTKRLHNLLHCDTFNVNGGRYYVSFGTVFYSLNELDCSFTVEDNPQFNWFSYNKNNRLTAWPTSKGCQPVTDDGRWRVEGRQEVRPSILINILKPHITFMNEDNGHPISEEEDPDLYKKVYNRYLEIFQERIKSQNVEFEPMFSHEISKVYWKPVADSNSSGYLANSCMRMESDYGCRHYSGFYNTIPGLQVMYQENTYGDLIMRALLWKAVNMDNGQEVTFLDRVYGTDAMIEAAIEYAKQQGWAWRGFSDCTIYLGDEKDIPLQVRITEDTVKYSKNEGIPYVDTLYMLDIDQMVLQNTSRRLGVIHTLQCCDGSPIEEVIGSCQYCGESIREHDDYIMDAHGNLWCDYCVERNRVIACQECSHWYPSDDVYFIENHGYVCSDCYENGEFERCGECHCHFHSQDITKVDGKHYCNKCINEVVRPCDDCGELHAIENIVPTVTGCYCNECMERITKKEEEVENECE